MWLILHKYSDHEIELRGISFSEFLQCDSLVLNSFGRQLTAYVRIGGTEYALTMPIKLATTLVTLEACIVLVVLDIFARLKEEWGNP